MNAKKTLLKLIDNFNYETVLKCMAITGWTWAGKEPAHIPSIDEMKMHCIDLFNHIDGINHTKVSSGGFELSYYKKENTMNLIFILEESSTELFGIISDKPKS